MVDMVGPNLLLGYSQDGWSRQPVVLGPSEVATHKHIIGTTGQGKSRLVQAMFVQLLQQGVGVSLIDPHRDLALDTLKYLIQQKFFDRPEAYRRLIYIDFAADRYVPFNLLKARGEPHDVAYFFLEAVKRAWPSISSGSAPNLENILLASTEALIEAGLPITRLPDILADPAFRDSVLERVTDEEVQRFFHLRFDQLGRSANQLSESTLRRIFHLTFAPVLRHTLGQSENVLDFRRFMDENVSVIYDLGGVQNPDARRLLGCLITVGYELAAMSRVDLPPGGAQRRQHHLILDEFAEFVAQSEFSLNRMLAACRKFGLYLSLIHQTWDQTSQKMRGALQNADVDIAFRLGRADAEVAARSLLMPDSALNARSEREEWTRSLQLLEPRGALIRSGNRPPRTMHVLDVRDVVAPGHKLKSVQDSYVSMYHRAPSQPEAARDSQRSQGREQARSRFRDLWS